VLEGLQRFGSHVGRSMQALAARLVRVCPTGKRRHFAKISQPFDAKRAQPSQHLTKF